jgi:iron(III) transport system permease protein
VRGYWLPLTLFAILVALPLLWLLVAAAAALRDAIVVGRLLDPRAWRLLGRSISVGLGVTAGAGLLGVPMALAMSRTRLPGCRALFAMTLLGLSVPPYTAAIAWSILLNRGAAPVPDLAQVIVALTSLSWPVVALLTAHALTRQPAVWEESARLETSAWHAALIAARPAMRRALPAALLLVFLLTLADYTVPATMGVTLYPVEIASSFQADRDASRSAALALPLLGIVLPLALLQRRLLDADPPAELGARTAADLPALPFGRWRAVATAGVWLIPSLAVCLPLLVLLRESLPLGTYPAVLVDALDPLRVSLLTAAAASLVATGMALALAARGAPGADRRPAGTGVRAMPPRPIDLGILNLLASLAYALPGSLIAIAWIHLLNRPGPLGALYDSVGVLAVAYVTRFFPFAWHSIASRVAEIDARLLEAARLDGATPVMMARWVILPLAQGAVLAAATLVFILATRELDATALLRPPDGDTLGFRIHDLYHYGPSRQVAALALLAALGTTGLVAGAWRFIARRVV